MKRSESSRRSSRKWWLSTIVVFVVGTAMAVVAVLGDQRLIENLVRIPSGCVTTIDIESTGRFYVYVETRGSINDVGECGNAGRRYDLGEPPTVDVQLLDDRGRSVDVRIDDSIEYDVPDFAGRSQLTFVVAQPGRFVVSAESADSAAVIAIGRRASTLDGAWLIGGAGLIMLALALLIIAMIVTLTRRRSSTTTDRAAVTYRPRDDEDMWAPPRPQDRASSGSP